MAVQFMRPTVVENDSSAGTYAWTNLNNAIGDDNVYATTSASFSGVGSYYLKFTNFGFTIPASATINGILWGIQPKKSGSGILKDYSVKMVKGGVISGTESATNTSITTVDGQVFFYGGATSLFGLTWTADDINASNFGTVWLCAEIEGKESVTGMVDDMGVWVYYTDVGKDYSRGDYTVLPTTDAALETVFASTEYPTVAADDASRVSQSAQAQYSIFEFKNKVNRSVQIAFTVTWNGQSDRAPSLSTMYLQIYNQTTDSWEALASNNTAAANTDFTLTGSKSTDLSDYFDTNNYVVCRVYQEAK